MGLLWSLLESDSVLLLEEPELSLNGRIVKELAPLIYRLQYPKQGQVILSTHSWDLLSDHGIGSEEVLLLMPNSKNTQIELAASFQEVRDLLEGEFNIADAVLPYTMPPNIEQWSLLK